MIPISLSLHNFLSYGEGVPPLDFSQFKVACLSGANGHGKSALLDAMTYALWGEARKAAHERKPDEGLMRLGSGEMRVEFTFALGEDHFRVLRSYRKARRSSSSQLELQIFDPEASSYRTLSEYNSLTKTQERINQLLSMDYDTFINSAFLVQGRADEFTQRNARQRKEILGEILGLTRYDQLQDLARSHLQQRQQMVQDHLRRLREIDSELADREVIQTKLNQINQQLAQLGESLAKGENQLEDLREKRIELGQVQRQLDEGGSEIPQRKTRRQVLEKELSHLRSQVEKDAHMLDETEQIERDFQSYQELTASEGQLRRKEQRLQELESERLKLENHIAEERHKVEQRCSQWEARCQALEEQLANFRTFLTRAATIEADYDLMGAAKRKEVALEGQRNRHQDLQNQQQHLRHQLELAQQRLETQQQNLENQSKDLADRQATRAVLEADRQTLGTQLQGLQDQGEERLRLKESGSEVRAQLDLTRHQIQSLEATMEDAQEKVQILQRSDQAECPLCGSALDETHRAQLEGELARQQQEQRAHLQTQRQIAAKLETQLDAKREHYQQLDRQMQQLPALQQQVAGLDARLGQLDEDTRQLDQLLSQIKELGGQLNDGQYALQERQALEQLQREIAALAYDPKEHDQLKASLQDHAKIEADYQRLAETRTQEEKGVVELEQATEKLNLARSYRQDRLYAPDEQNRLASVEAERDELAYDPKKHQQVREQIDQLSDAIARRERLIAAQQRHAANCQTLEKNQTELDELCKTLDALEQQQTQLKQQLEGLKGVDERFDTLAKQLSAQRAERDQYLQQQGSLQSRHQHLEALAAEREEVTKQLENEEREVWLYQQLSEAYGKDGIQALIIENTIPELEEEANAILSRLTDNRIQIAIESLRDLKKGGTRETLDIKIADEIGERSYHLYSGGEAFRTNFALRLALSKVLARRAGAPLRTLIIDEGFGTQDAEGLEQLVEAIQVISNDFDKVLVVTHLPEMKNAFPVQIEVTKHPDIGSRFQIIQPS